ncbi:MAG: ABC transporter permease [Candidatus Aenigmarchaeota archaeon]|nr:ABC transporter permease [Candidatus Aenigmarchaeota archaeon]
MKINRVFALIYYDILVFSRAKWRVMEMFYFPITTVIMWGLFSAYMRSFAVEAGLIVLVLNIFWNFASVAQSNTNMQIMDDSWSGSIKQMLISGIRESEYIFARIISTTVISVALLGILLSMSLHMFDLRVIFEKPAVSSMLFLSTLIASVAMSILIAAFIITAGKEYGFLSWTVLQIFILLSAPFYPVSVFPDWLQSITTVMPYTATFENARALAANNAIDNGLLARGLLISILYLALSLPVYFYAFKRARKTGYLVKLGS